MLLHDLIFSEDRKYRLLRHSIFCLCVIAYSLVRIGIMFPADQLVSLIPSYLFFVFYWTSIILVFSYTVVYFLVPKFLHPKKYALFVLGLLVLIFLLLIVSSIHNLSGANKGFLSVTGVPRKLLNPSGIIRILGNPPLVCCLLLSLKSVKTWHLKQKEKETLTRENINAELQLLKAQVHPHFLFNTLNNIYSYSLNKSSQAAGLVQKLRSMLQYMITECDQPLVPIKSELKMIQDYLGLEKIRYGNRLSMQVEIKNDHKNEMIAPLLMIPFVENSFKHGTSQMLEHPWVRLKILVENDMLLFDLSNSKPVQPLAQNTKHGIGLNNVCKRLELLYPGQHELQTGSTDDEFSVHLQIILNKATGKSEKTIDTIL